MNEVIVAQRRRDGGSLAVIGKTIAPHEATFAVARQCAEWKASLPLVTDLASARIVRAVLLPNLQSIDAAWRDLADMTTSDRPDEAVTEPQALRMLAGLYGALAKRQTDARDGAALLQVTAEMFSETDTALARVINVEPLPRHPVVLALAVKKLIATKVFAPAPSELRKALLEVRNRIVRLRCDVSPVLEMARAAERLVFQQDREGWRLPYVSGDVPSIVAVELVDYGDGQESWWSAVEALRHDEEA